MRMRIGTADSLASTGSLSCTVVACSGDQEAASHSGSHPTAASRKFALGPVQYSPDGLGAAIPTEEAALQQAARPISDDMYSVDRPRFVESAMGSQKSEGDESYDDRFIEQDSTREPAGLSVPIGLELTENSLRSRQKLMNKLRKVTENRSINQLYANNQAARVCTHPWFEPVAITVICMNAMWTGYSVDTQDPDGKDPPSMHRRIDYGFCFFFSVEVFLRINAYRNPIAFFLDKVQRSWNWFDFMLVILLIGETWMMPLVAQLLKSAVPEIPALSAMRMLRMLRMVRVLRVVPELSMMVRSLGAAIRSSIMTVVLAVGIMYIFSIVLTQWAQSHTQKFACSPPETCIQEAFGTIPKSLLTLLQILCFDETFVLIRAVMKERLQYAFVLLLFIFITAFTVLHLLIGVVCQIVADTSLKERDDQMKQQVTSLFWVLEIESTGLMSRKELERNKTVLRALDKLGVDQDLLRKALSIIDRKMITQGVDPTHVDVEEILEVVFRLLHPPQTQDICLVQSKLQILEKSLQDAGMNEADKANDLKLTRASGVSRHAVEVRDELTSTLARLQGEETFSTEELHKTFVLNIGKKHELKDKIKQVERDIKATTKKLEQAEEAVATTGKELDKVERQTKESMRQSNKLFEAAADDDTSDIDDSGSLAVQNNLWALEAQISEMLFQGWGTPKRPAKACPGVSNWDVELRGLDAAMCRLRVRLERCQEESSSAPLELSPTKAEDVDHHAFVFDEREGSRHLQSTAASSEDLDYEATVFGERRESRHLQAASPQAAQPTSTDLEYWKKLCGEVVQCISAVSLLMGEHQSVREAEPDQNLNDDASSICSF